MEESFKLRVDKIFGSLVHEPSAASPSSLNTLWCLTDDEIERRTWNRDKGELEPEPDSDSQPKYDEDLEEDDDDVEEKDDLQRRGSSKPDDYNDEEWEVKSSIGLDCTLDYEEEEDEFDKVAVGKEKGEEDRVYMKNIDEYGINIDSGSELPSSFKQVIKDSRANHLAAKIRIKEDDEAAKKIHSLRVSDQDQEQDTGPSNPKSILKRKDNPLDSKSTKRVRFDPQCKDTGDTHTEGGVADADADADASKGVPDYLRNPSRYTHYTFDSTDEVNEESNKQAFMNIMNLLKKSGTTTKEDAFNPPRSVTFIPRKKTGDTSAMVDSCTELVQQVGIGKDVPVRPSIAAATADAQETDVSAMEEDEPESLSLGKSSSQKPGRQYRMKARSESDE